MVYIHRIHINTLASRVLGVREIRLYWQQRSCYWPLSLDVLFTHARAQTTALSTTSLSLSLYLSHLSMQRKKHYLKLSVLYNIYSYLQMYTNVIYMMQTNFTSKTAEFLRSFEQATQNSMQDGVGRSHTTGVGWLSRSISDRFSCLWSWVPRVDLSWIYVRRCEDCELGCCDLNIFVDMRELRFIIVR